MDGPAVKRQRLLPENTQEEWSQWFLNLKLLQEKLLSGCLCHVNRIELQRPLVSCDSPSSQDYTYQFISTINLLSDTALKQQNGGFICSKISEMAYSITSDESIWDLLLHCLDSSDKFTSFATSKCTASFLLYTTIAHVDLIFDELFTQLMLGASHPLKLSSILEIIRAVIDYKDEDDHPLDLEPATSNSTACTRVEIDLGALESEVKNLCIKSLENWWTRVVSKFKNLIQNYNSKYEFSIVSFLTLWQTIISVKSNLSVIDTKHFYLNVEAFVALLTSAIPPIIWRKIIDIFNEILCYGSTLSLQDSPPEEACNLAHLIIRCIKSRQLLQELPYTKEVFSGFGGTILAPVEWEWESKDTEGRIQTEPESSNAPKKEPIEVRPKTPKNSMTSDGNPSQSAPSAAAKVEKPVLKTVITATVYIGPDPNAVRMDDLSLNDSESCNGDKPLLQKFVLLVLKSVAVTVMEARDEDCDSSEGGSGESEDGEHSGSESDATEMHIIEKSIREVFQHLDQFVKVLVPYHPSTPLAEWIVKLFSDQDDVLVEGMLCTLDTFTCFLGRIEIPVDFSRTLNPIQTFIAFAGTISEDKDTLLDLLMSNETSFLLYLLRFLKFAFKNWPQFVANCGCNLERTMSLLIRLRLALHKLVEKSLFPYNINPVLRLLEKCEDLYESSDNANGSRSVASNESNSNPRILST